MAPYEADAQLAYLSINNYVDCVITEDSDLLTFGAKKVLSIYSLFTLISPIQVLFKLDKDGNGKEIALENLAATSSLKFSNFTHDMFRWTCMLAGCDYLPSVSGLGIKKAHNLVSKLRNVERVKLLFLLFNNNNFFSSDFKIFENKKF